MASVVIKMENWRQELKERGLSLGDMEDRTGFSKTYISKVLDGKKKAPEASVQRILHEFRNCPWCHRRWKTRTKVEDLAETLGTE